MKGFVSKLEISEVTYIIGVPINLRYTFLPYAFIIDKSKALRGRDDDDGIKFGYDSRSVADINNNMLDDVKIILAEYRMALKKNNVFN